MVSHKQGRTYLIRSKRYKLAKFIIAVLDILVETKTFDKLKQKLKRKYKERYSDNKGK